MAYKLKSRKYKKSSKRRLRKTKGPRKYKKSRKSRCRGRSCKKKRKRRTMRGGNFFSLFKDMQHAVTTGSSNLISTGYGSTNSNNTPSSHGQRISHVTHWQKR